MHHRSAHYCAGCPHPRHARTGTPSGRIARGGGAGLSRAARSREPREGTPYRRAGRLANPTLPDAFPHRDPSTPRRLMATRQELYDRIQKSSKEEVILEEMVRLGFWPREMGQPEDTREELERRRQLQQELTALMARETHLHDAEKVKKELRKKRMQESRERQQETKLRRLRERQERAEAWRERKAHEILYLGEGVSAGLQSIETALDKLRARGLPLLATAENLAVAMGIT